MLYNMYIFYTVIHKLHILNFISLHCVHLERCWCGGRMRCVVWSGYCTLTRSVAGSGMCDTSASSGTPTCQGEQGLAGGMEGSPRRYCPKMKLYSSMDNYEGRKIG